MSEWVMIIWIAIGGYGSAAAINHVPFGDKQSCKAALGSFEKTWVKARCIKRKKT